MIIAILIIAHIIYFWKIVEGAIDGEPRGLLTGTLLVLLSWDYNSTWGIVTLVYVLILFIIACLITN